MTDESKDAMPDLVQERVGRLENEMHTVRYQLDEFHKLPPRVSSLERAVDVMSLSLSHIEKDMSEVKEGNQEIRKSQNQHVGDIAGMSRAIKMGTGLLGFAAIGTAAVIWFVAL